MAEFKRIGTGVAKKTKKGGNAIVLTLDKDAQGKLANHDFEKGVWLFENKNDKGNTYWSVMCPMPDDYEINYDNLAKNWAKKFEDKHKGDSKDEFTKWQDK
jgi:hypothetical protein